MSNAAPQPKAPVTVLAQTQSKPLHTLLTTMLKSLTI